MSTFLYNSARASFATKQIDWTSSSVRCVLLNGSYAPQPAHQFLSDIPVGARMIDAALTGLAQKNGICYGTIPQFNAFIAGSPVVSMVLYILAVDHADADSPLIYYSDDGRGFPFTPQGFNYAVGYDQSAGGFFQV